MFDKLSHHYFDVCSVSGFLLFPSARLYLHMQSAVDFRNCTNERIDVINLECILCNNQTKANFRLTT